MTSHQPDLDAEQLAAFQIAVLTSLGEGGDPADLQRSVRGAAGDPALAAWVDAWEPDLVALASLLVQTWAVTDDSRASPTLEPGSRRIERR